MALGAAYGELFTGDALYGAALTHQLIPSADEVYDGALGQHPDWLERDTLDPSLLKGIARQALQRSVLLEEAARQPLTVTPEAAHNIDTIWILSGTGLAGRDRSEAELLGSTKGKENKALIGREWMQGWDHARVAQGVRLARKIAEVRSGRTISGSMSSVADRAQATRELIAEHGPTLFYSGYEVETSNAAKLLTQEGTVIPAEKAHILSTPLRVSTDQVKTFEYPSDEARTKNVAIVSHGTHLAGRILHMMQRYQPLDESAQVPYLVPVPTLDVGRKQFAQLEGMGLLNYFMEGDAAEVPHAWQLLPVMEQN